LSLDGHDLAIAHGTGLPAYFQELPEKSLSGTLRPHGENRNWPSRKRTASKATRGIVKLTVAPERLMARGSGQALTSGEGGLLLTCPRLALAIKVSDYRP